MKRCSTSLIIRETQIKTTMRHHLTLSEWPSLKNLQTINTESMWRKGNISALLAGMYIPHNHCGEEYFLKKLKRELPYDPATPLLDVYSEKTVI